MEHWQEKYYKKSDTKFSKLTEAEWKVILDEEQRKLFNLPDGTKIQRR